MVTGETTSALISYVACIAASASVTPVLLVLHALLSGRTSLHICVVEAGAFRFA